MRSLVSAELLKLRSTRSAWIPLAAALSAHHVPLAWSQPGVPGAVAAVPLLAALYGVLGASLGLLLRNTAAAVGLALTWAFVVEGIVPALIHEPCISHWLPEAAANAVLHAASPTVEAGQVPSGGPEQSVRPAFPPSLWTLATGLLLAQVDRAYR